MRIIKDRLGRRDFLSWSHTPNTFLLSHVQTLHCSHCFLVVSQRLCIAYSDSSWVCLSYRGFHRRLLNVLVSDSSGVSSSASAPPYVSIVFSISTPRLIIDCLRAQPAAPAVVRRDLGYVRLSSSSAINSSSTLSV